MHNEARRFIAFLDVWYDLTLSLTLTRNPTLTHTLTLVTVTVTVTPPLTRYDRRRKLLMSAAVPLASIFERLRPEAMREATDWDGAAVLPAGADAAVSVRGEGGSSSGHATTYLADNTEWSATGRMGVSLAGVAALNDAAFAQRRAASRLQEMIGSAAWGRVRGSSLGSRGAAAYAAAAAESGGGAES